MDTASFWLQKSRKAEEILCTPASVREINQLTRQRLPHLVFDLSQYPAYIPSSVISDLILENEFPKESLYIDGNAVSADYYRDLYEAMSLGAFQGMVQIEYGFTLRRANIRTFPTNDFCVFDPEDREFDQFQETILDPAEPLVILHRSGDEKWQFIQSGNYRGWIETDATAVTKDRSLWLKYSQASDFLVVTGNRLFLGEDPYTPAFSGLVFSMGATLPLVDDSSIPPLIGNRAVTGCHAVWLPVRNCDAMLDFRPALVAKSADVHQGYLPFSRANLLRQAFKMQGDRYGWGGLFGSRDCSALVQDIFRSVGVYLARNAGEQAQGAGTQIPFTDISTEERSAVLRSLPPGSTLHFPGHVMFYLGEHNDQFYVIHAIAACGDPSRPQLDGTLARLPLNGVMVTDLSLTRVNGKSLLESITEANCIP